MDELDAVLNLVKGAEHHVDTVARVAVDGPHALLVQALQHEPRHVLGLRQILLS